MTASSPHQTDWAYLRARELLQNPMPLSVPEMEELQGLFHEMSGTQFMAITSDAVHGRALLQYNRFMRRRAFPVTALLIALVILSVVVGAAIVFSV